MLRDHLDKIPDFDLPSGYHSREYRPGDEETWVSIQSAADFYNTITLELYRREFSQDPIRLSERQLYLCNSEDHTIGTATAWFGDYDGRDYGRIHWVAIVPEFQGKGLAKPLMTVTCNRLKAMGHKRAYLTTSSARVAAINLYLKFGFRIVDIREMDVAEFELLIVS